MPQPGTGDRKTKTLHALITTLISQGAPLGAGVEQLMSTLHAWSQDPVSRQILHAALLEQTTPGEAEVLLNMIENQDVATYTEVFEQSFDEIDQRSVFDIFVDLTDPATGRGNGREPLPPFEPGARWRARDTVGMKAVMADYYRTGKAKLANVLYAATQEEVSLAARRTNAGFAERQRIDHKVNTLTKELHRVWNTKDLSLVQLDPFFVDMVQAAAMSAPEESLHSDELIAPAALVVFADEAPRELFGVSSPVRALLWRETSSHINFYIYSDTGYDMTEVKFSQPRENYSDLYPELVSRELLLKSVGGDISEVTSHKSQGSALVVRFLRALNAVAASPKVNTESVTISPRVKRGRKRLARNAAGQIRLLSLRPVAREHGALELDAAHDRRGVRLHYVRGHWRNQWYPSLNEHRSKWIDGYPKGDPALGSVVDDPTVHIGRG